MGGMCECARVYDKRCGCPELSQKRGVVSQLQVNAGCNEGFHNE